MLSRFGHPIYSTTARAPRHWDWSLWDPFADVFKDFDSRMKQLESTGSGLKVSPFQSVFGGNAVTSPPVDIYETPEEFVVTSSIPGVAPSDLNVDYDAQTRELNISGEVGDEQSKEYRDQHMKFSERSYGRFERTILLPESTPVDEDQIEAKISNGVLRVKLPKVVAAAPKKRAITVTSEDAEEGNTINKSKGKRN